MSPDQLFKFLIDLMAVVLLNRTTLDFTTYLIHHKHKPSHLGQYILRDTTAIIHFYHIKEEFLKSTKYLKILPERFKPLTQLQYCSKKNLLSAPDYWGFVVKFIIHYNSQQKTCQYPDSAKDVLLSWNLVASLDMRPPCKKPSRPNIFTPLWLEQTSHTRD